MNTSTQQEAPVTRIARRRAKPGRESDYEASIHDLFVVMARQPGFISAKLIPPETTGGDYQVISQFNSEEALQAWDNTDARLKQLDALHEFAEGEPEFRQLTGLEAWFAPIVVPASVHPPRARMSLVTWLGIFPVVSLYLWLLGPLLAPLPYLLRTAILTALVVVTMTWLVMPRLTRLLRGWINRQARAG